MAQEDTEPLAWWSYVGVGVLWFASSFVLEAGGVTSEGPHLLLAAAFIGTFGVACLVNGQRCGALHCRISGPGYLAVAALAVLAAAGILNVSRGWIMILFGGVFVASYALEFALDHRAEPTS